MKLTAARTIGVEDESPHRESRVEWWFVQGTWQGLHKGREARGALQAASAHHFMVSLFRQSQGPGAPPCEDGSWLLTSVLAPGRDRADCSSKVDRPSLDLFARAARGLQRTNVDARVIDAYLQEVSEYGPPAPIQLAGDSPGVAGAPLSIAWDTFSLSQPGNRFALAFLTPGEQRACLFRLDPSDAPAPPSRVRG